MAIYFQPSPPASTPSSTSTYRYLGGNDVYINYSSAGVTLGVVGSPAGKIAFNNYDAAKAFLSRPLGGSGFWGSIVPSSNDPWTVTKNPNPLTPPTVKATTLIEEQIVTAGVAINSNIGFTPVNATGGSAVYTNYDTNEGTLTGTVNTSTSPLIISITPALPAGLTWYPSKTNIVAGTVKPTQDATYSSVAGAVNPSQYRVTYTIASLAGSPPVVGKFYAVRGQTKVTYNGIWKCTAYDSNTQKITLEYPGSTGDPSVSGGATNALGGYQGQGAWQTTSYVTITDIDVVSLARLDNSTTYEDWVNYASVTIIGTPQNADVGTKTYTVTFTDQKGQQGSASFKLTINQGAQDLSYTLNISTRSIIQGATESGFKPITAAGGTLSYTYSIVSPLLPSGLTINPNTGIISGIPTAYSAETEYTIKVQDTAGASKTDKFKLTVTAPAVIAAAVPANIPASITRSVPFTTFKPVNGSGGYGTLSYSADLLPAGLSINTTTGNISGTATSVTAATPYVIRVTDSNTPVASSANASITLSVIDLPTLNATLDPNAPYSLTKRSGTYSFTPITGVGGYLPTGTKLSYAITGTVSLSTIGLAINPDTGLISGNPSALLVPTNFTITVSDKAQPPQTTSTTFSIEVVAVALSTKLDVGTPPPAIKNVAISSFRPVSATGGDGSYTFSISPNITSLTGLLFNTSTGYVSGTATTVTSNVSYDVTVTDQTTPSPQTSFKSFTLKVDSPPVIIISAISSKELTQYDTFTAFTPVTALGGYVPVGTSLTYSITGTNNTLLPAGLTFVTNGTNAGQITGPATKYLVTATEFIVTVSDQAQQTTSTSFLLTVKTRPLVVKTDVGSNTFIRDVNATSYKPVSATGGSESYVYALDISLPTGLIFTTSTGIVSGKATTTSTTATYTVTITDTLNTSGSSTFELGVNPPPPIVTFLTSPTVSSSTIYKASPGVIPSSINLSPVSASGGYGSITFSINPDIKSDTSLIFSETGNLLGQIPGTKSNFTKVYTISATDTLGQTSSTNYTITVTYVPLSINRATTPSLTFTKNKNISDTTLVTSQGGSGGTSFSIYPDITADTGLNFDGTVGKIYGKPSTTTTNVVYTITAQDSDSNSTSTTTSIIINPPAPLSTTASISLVTLTVDTLISTTYPSGLTPVNATGGDGTISYSIAPTLPLGLTFDGNNGSITGSPTSTSTTATYFVIANDTLLPPQLSTSSFDLYIKPKPVSISAPNPTVILTKYRSAGLPIKPVVATGGFGSIKYALSELLPDGLLYNEDIGEISGSPNAIKAETIYNVVATDRIGQFNSATFTLTVNDVIAEPLTVSVPESSFSLGLNDPVTIHPVIGINGVGSYTYAINKSLPAGLSFDTNTGDISGTPSSSSTAVTYTITITDTVPISKSGDFSLEVILLTTTGGKGYTGSRGYTGSKGYTGSVGYTGSAGYTGSTGTQGVTGFTGSTGTQGYTGSTGTQGEIGFTGSTGTQGEIGFTGSTGTQGIIGFTGSQGDKGEQGLQGTTGTQGPRGYTGEQGVSVTLIGSTATVGGLPAIGNAGDGWIVEADGDLYFWNTITSSWNNVGQIVGPQGAEGLQGNMGPQGPQGNTGTQGIIGFTGSTGTQGVTGYTGSTGTQGEIGFTGSTGTQGIIGFTGSTGTQGEIGFTGSTGTQGIIGFTGSTGTQGIIGFTGSTGTQGEIGFTGSTGTQGEIGFTGSTGTQGITGFTGSTGTQGEIGFTGSTGTQGEIGFTGSTGTQGEIGFTGSTGTQGVTGFTGSTGTQGEIGFTGSTGTQGVTGFTGSTGTQGIIGFTGSQGDKGDQGLQGTTGTQGPRGYTGEQGVSVTLIGSTATIGGLPATGNPGDGWIVEADGDLYFWNTITSTWNNVGQIVGPQGAEGLQGNMGPQGPQGNTGTQGIIGFTGSTGTQGVTGYTGSTGTQGEIGFTGSTGTQGITGYTGSTGTQGEIGFTGSTGTQGEIGFTGSTGTQGEIGFTGSTGTQGEIGFTGSTGTQGVTGFTGSTGTQGETGFTGSTGTQGEIGFTGSTGTQGVTGFTGSTGTQGIIGFTGSTGTQGIIGFTGSTGTQGEVGFTGSTGTQGVTGFTGSTGTQGEIGFTGSTGTQGVTGYTGSTGTQGEVGYTGSTGTQGEVGFTGSTGTQGIIGFTGSTGTQGVTGYTGSTGTQGEIGYTGSTGTQGVTGYTGSTGTQGVTGYTGSTGTQGVTGFTGSTGTQGEVGFTGSTGTQGEIGFTGSTGTQGEIGFTGSTGTQGVTGFTGSTGTQGIIGFTGSQGDKGDQGLQGTTGTQGPRGYTGDQGVSVTLIGSTATVGGLPAIGNAGDGWIVEADGDLYFWNTITSTWNNVGQIVGPQGAEGLQGNMGPQGPQGNTGTQGIIGFTGSTGTQGEVGFTGSTGTQGNIGFTGSTGTQGVTGYTGSTGTQGNIGFTGSTGTQGEIGFTGSTGTQGEIGFTGSTGTQGEIGFTGSTGTQGEIGFTGSTGTQGEIGFTGSTGTQGVTGFTGSTGTQGEIGFTGSTGTQGITGFTGSTGTQGEIGFTGSTGTQGIIGFTGSTGTQGEVGFTGSTGTQGEIGFTGSTGTQGEIGFTGSTGTQGIIGFTGSTGTQGEVGFTGSTGTQGEIGFTGSAGNIGYTGSTGTQGEIGFTGSTGTQGVTGFTGSTGTQGEIGFTGSTGTQGVTGFTGSTGTQGIIGFTGSQGDKGDQGLQGTTGTQGPRGYTGEQGVSVTLIGSTSTVGGLPAIGNAGDGWIVEADGDLYFWNTITSTWNNVGQIVGPQGAEGLQGNMGPQGPQGNTGTQGIIGFTGSTGTQGNIGFTGSTGTQGNIGFTGSTGTQGVTGFTGSTGTQGEIGFTGSTGTQGEIGFTGSQGPQGFQGPQGNQGGIGFTGSASTETGYTGSVGFTGSTGTQGVIGFTGSASTETGYTGSVGYTGSTGTQGVIGFTGSTGNQGNSGTRGYSGSAGYTGSQGTLGFTGSKGEKGDPGTGGGGGGSYNLDGGYPNTNYGGISSLDAGGVT